LSDNENATSSVCQLHVKMKLSQRNKNGKVPVDFLDIWQLATKGK